MRAGFRARGRGSCAVGCASAVVVLAAEDYRRLRGDGPSLVEFIRSALDFDALELDRAEDRGRDVDL